MRYAPDEQDYVEEEIPLTRRKSRQVAPTTTTTEQGQLRARRRTGADVAQQRERQREEELDYMFPPDAGLIRSSQVRRTRTQEHCYQPDVLDDEDEDEDEQQEYHSRKTERLPVVRDRHGMVAPHYTQRTTTSQAANPRYRTRRTEEQIRRYKGESDLSFAQRVMDWASYHIKAALGTAVALLAVAIIGGNLLVAVGTNIYNDLRYGKVRTYQLDANVGHPVGEEHFIVLNLHGTIELIEQPEMMNSKDMPTVYTIGQAGSTWAMTAKQVPVTLEVVQGKGNLKDLVIHIGGNTVHMTNTGKGFTEQTQQG